MQLTPDQEAILRGASGEALSLAMRTLVDYGRAFGAGRLVPVKSVHTVGSCGLVFFKRYIDILGRLAGEGVRVKVRTTVNPHPGRTRTLLTRVVFIRQASLERALAALGVTLNYSCVCYDEQAPGLGDRLAWSESSAVQFANSVLGARTNRNSLGIDMCSAVTGLTPEYGCLLDENRRGQVLVKLQVSRMDPAALGYVIGQRVVDRVPVIEHHPFSRGELRDLGAAMAASGAVSIFHVEGLTPEAPDLGTVFDGAPHETITVTQADLDALRSPDRSRVSLVVFGCPHLTLEEAVALAERFAGHRVRCPTWVCMAPATLERFASTPQHDKAVASGVTFASWCPLATLSVRLSPEPVLTPSAKLFYYLQGAIYGTADECLEVCGVRP